MRSSILPKKRKYTEQSQQDALQSVASQLQQGNFPNNSSVTHSTEPPIKKQKLNILKQLFLLLMNDYEALNT